MVKLADLPEHTRELIWKQPPESWVRRNVTFWKEKRASWSKEKWHNEVVEYYHLATSVNYQEALPLRACRVCNLEFDSQAYKFLHLNQYSHKCALAKKNREPIPPDPLFCVFCDYRAVSKATIARHKIDYDHVCKVASAGNKPIPTNEKFCKVCNQTFSSVGAYKNHRNTVRHRQNLAKEDEKSIFNCGPCNKCFNTKQHLHRHQGTRAHCIKIGKVQEKTKFCALCSKEYKNRRSYLKHCRQMHAPAAPKITTV